MMLQRLHRWLAWLFALPLMWMALTGALLGFAGESDRIAHVDLMTTPQSTQAVLSQAQQREHVESFYGQPVSWQSWRPASNPVDTGVATISQADGQWQQVFVQTKSGEINGVRTIEDDWRIVLYKAHRMTFLGDAGVYVAWISASGWLLLLMSGAAFQYRKTVSIAKASIHLRWALWLSLPIGIISLTGLGMALFSEPVTHWGAWLLQYEQASNTVWQWSSWHTGQALAMPGRILWGVSSVGLFLMVVSALWLGRSHQQTEL